MMGTLFVVVAMESKYGICGLWHSTGRWLLLLVLVLLFNEMKFMKVKYWVALLLEVMVKEQRC